MIILLYGEDTYRSRERLRTLREAFRKKFDPYGVNIVRLDGETLTPEDFNRAVGTQGFLATKRFLVVERLIGDGSAETQQAVRERVMQDKDQSDNVVVFWEQCAEPPKATGRARKAGAEGARLWAALAALAKLERFAPLTPAALLTWIEREVKKRDGTIDKKAVQRLITLVGTNLWQLSSELDKLTHYRAGQVITEDDVDLLVSAPIDDNIFRLTDALGARDEQLALQLLEEQFQSGTAPLSLLRMLAWHTRTLAAVRSALDTGVSAPRAIAQQLKLHPFVAQKAAKQASLFTLQELRSMFDGLLAIDRTIKTRQVDPRALFTLFVVKTAHANTGSGAVPGGEKTHTE